MVYTAEDIHLFAKNSNDGPILRALQKHATSRSSTIKES